jgi:hypothetical protein
MVSALGSNREFKNGEREITALFDGFGDTAGMPLNHTLCWGHKF